MSIRALTLSLALTAAGLAATAAQAPQAQPPDPQRPVFRTEANFVRVDVFPTRGGVPLKNLSAADFEVLEDGVAQKVETFEFVQVRAGFSNERREPNTIAEAREATRNPRARLFVLFLDVPHVTVQGAWSVRQPLVRLLDRILAPDDLIGIMTPNMAASDIVFARKTEVIAGGLTDRWPWGERFTLQEDDREFMYNACFPTPGQKEVVAEMKARRRERKTLDSLTELVSWLRSEREERKAILTISEGWALFRRNEDLTRPRIISPETGQMEPIPGPEPIGVGPDGRIRVGNRNGSTDFNMTECHRDRQYLSQIDNDEYFRDLLDEANRANASFYTVDPRGLPVFDSQVGPEAPPTPIQDLKNLNHRLDSLRVLAANTDGLAVLNSNDIERGLRRMADDLNSYYLLGYYTSNAKLDGRFRQIKVRVKQPGVEVRARRGYKAATQREVTEARKAAAPVAVPEHTAAAHKALASLARLRPSAPFKARAIAVQGDAATIWVAGEMSAPATAAATAEISAVDSNVRASASVAPGQRGFVVPLPLGRRMTEPVELRIRVTQPSGSMPLTEMIRIDPPGLLPDPLFFRRGPSTGNRLEPAGEPAFSRTERVRFELPAGGDVRLTVARVLDRNGVAGELPVTLSERTDASGQRWAVGDLTLAPLGAGDYVLEITGSVAGATHTLLTAFRVNR